MSERTKLTPPELARQWGVATNKVLHWIDTGELRAVNLARDRNGRPRWAIDRADIEAFERARQASPAVPRIRRRRQPAGVKDYF